MAVPSRQAAAQPSTERPRGEEHRITSPKQTLHPRLPDHLRDLIDAAVQRRAGRPPCAPDTFGTRDERYATRPLDGTADYHLWSPSRSLSTIGCPHQRPDYKPYWTTEELAPPVPATQIPPAQRCGVWVAPRYFPRPYAGPLPQQWPAPSIPRWYAWWRLHDLQDGTCATCPSPAYALDHDHTTGLVRGLLCVSCNKREGNCAARVRTGAHPGRPCFQDYWDNPPASPLRWLYGPGSLRHA
ncbi:endonuclease VII domain-containing protein [Streptomyces pilosus]|uniref:endonuclease VII domain-containing protein n=1 Tax=Streptomyces pilosus TaxID=28893 RepID=UPI003637FA16